MERGIIAELEARELIYQQTHQDLDRILAELPTSVYCGFDPSGESLHLGHLVPLLVLARFQRAGHRPIAVAGGGTGMIGDPSGKCQERQLLTRERMEHNLARIKLQLARFLDFEDRRCSAKIVNNYDWLGAFSLIHFLRDVGKHFTISQMLAKESVRSRLETGISFTEFSYMLLQSYDFLHLSRSEGCLLQIGGQDQWGNIVSGADLIRRVDGKEAYGITFPLITSSSGRKFGKTESGSVWLDPQMTSPYAMYQFWIQTEDSDVLRYLKFFTFLSLEEIAEYEERVRTEPERRAAQRRLAEEMTTAIHGPEACQAARRASEVLFGGEISGLGDEQLLEIFSDVPAATLPFSVLAGGLPLIQVLADQGITPSRGEARRLIETGGLYVNNRRVSEKEKALGPADLASEHFIVIRTGKRKYHLLRFAD